jgi:hypothetical protein
MSGRVSIKGQGADIFFGKDTDERSVPPSGAIETSEEEDDTELSNAPSSSPESKPAIKTTGQQAGLPASQQDSEQAPGLEDEVPLGASKKSKLRELLQREHRTHNTYRYHADELAAVRDIVYKLEVRWGRKVTRNDVMRAALLWAIEDYKERGEQSLLVELFKEEGHRR